MSDLDPIQELNLSPGGPALAGARWFAAIVDKADLNEAWQLTAATLRLALVQSWLIFVGRHVADDRDRVAAKIAAGSGPDWEEFAVWRLGRWRGDTFSLYVEEGWGLVSLVEPIGPDIELVRFGPGRQGRTFQPGEAFLASALTMQLVGGLWLVAGIGRTLAVPGWPPREQVLPSDMAG